MYLRSRSSGLFACVAISTISWAEGDVGGSQTSVTVITSALPVAGKPACVRSSSAESADSEPSYAISSLIVLLASWTELNTKWQASYPLKTGGQQRFNPTAAAMVSKTPHPTNKNSASLALLFHQHGQRNVVAAGTTDALGINDETCGRM